MKLFLPTLLAFAITLSGCGSVEFIPYQGAQQDWPTEPGAFVDRQYSLPVYHGRPSRPYIMLGAIEVESAGGFTSASSAVGDAVNEARKHGAEAVIFVSKSMERGEHPLGHSKVIAIKWR